MANGNLTINVTVNGAEDIAKLTKEFEKLKALVGEGNVTVESQEFRLITDREPKAGDFAKITATGDDDLTVGKYYEIHYIDDDGDFGITDDIGHSSYIMKSDGDYFEVYEKVGAEDPEVEPLKVGDYAKVVNKIHEFEVDNIVKIVSDEARLFDFKVEFVNVTGKSKRTGQTHGFIDAKNIVKATDEEVASVMKEQAQAKAETRWAKIGRKPNEFKKGDIVRVISGSGSSVKSGDIGEVGEFNHDMFRVNTVHTARGNFQRAKDVELITPVEQRFDFAEVSA